MNVPVSSTEGAYLRDLAEGRQVVPLSNSMGHRILTQLYAADLHILLSSGPGAPYCRI